MIEPRNLAQILRRLMTDCDMASALLGGSIADLDPGLEVSASQLRPKVDELATLGQQFLEQLETSKPYVEARRAHLETFTK